jgi:hypothetical protein
MLQYASINVDVPQRRRKTASIIPRAIVLSAVPSIVDRSHLAPELARGVSHYRVRAGVLTSIARFVPRVDSIDAEVAPIGLNEEGCDGVHINPAGNRIGYT